MVIGLVVGLGLIGLGGGCAKRGVWSEADLEGLTTDAGGTLGGVVWADWDDLDAALEVALTKAELATLTTTSSDDRRTWTLVGMGGDEGLLVVTRDTNAGRDARGCEQLTLEVRVGGPGGERSERTLLMAMRARLQRLAGVEWAPVE